MVKSAQKSSVNPADYLAFLPQSNSLKTDPKSPAILGQIPQSDLWSTSENVPRKVRSKSPTIRPPKTVKNLIKAAQDKEGQR